LAQLPTKKEARQKGRAEGGRQVEQREEAASPPADWGPSVSNYRYVYSDNHVYFVEPSSRRVISIID
jgi:hypothetical protein